MIDDEAYDWLAGALADMAHERNDARAERDDYHSRLIDAEQQLGRCICAPFPHGDGPQEDCGIHGRTYAYWVEGFGTVQLRLQEAVHERDLLRRELARLRGRGRAGRRPFDPDHCTACGDFLPCGDTARSQAVTRRRSRKT